MDGLTCADLPLAVDVRQSMIVSRHRRVHQQLAANEREKKKVNGLVRSESQLVVDVTEVWATRHTRVWAIAMACLPVEYLIVDGPDDNSVTKTAAHGRRSVNTSPVIIDLDARQDPSSSSFQKRTDDISCSEADTVSCLSACEVP